MRTRDCETRRSSVWHRWCPRVIGIVGSVAIHALLIQATTLGATAQRKRAPEETGAGASAIVTGGEPFMTVVLIHLPGTARGEPMEALSSRGITPVPGPIQVFSPDAAPAIDESEVFDEKAEAVQTVGDPQARSMLFGRYVGQIDARIKRAWRRPRTPVTEPSQLHSQTAEESAGPTSDEFHCLARVRQDDRGVVLEVELVRCNGTLAWQQSLINAVQQASPLPAPPNPTVFTNTFTLSFESPAFKTGFAEEDYEPEAQFLVRMNPSGANTQQVSRSFGETGTPRDPGLPFDAPVAPRTDL